jgi:hypothetical protein
MVLPAWLQLWLTDMAHTSGNIQRFSSTLSILPHGLVAAVCCGLHTVHLPLPHPRAGLQGSSAAACSAGAAQKADSSQDACITVLCSLRLLCRPTCLGWPACLYCNTLQATQLLVPAPVGHRHTRLTMMVVNARGQTGRACCRRGCSALPPAASGEGMAEVGCAGGRRWGGGMGGSGCCMPRAFHLASRHRRLSCLRCTGGVSYLL